MPGAEAERLLVFGFFNEVLDRVEWSGMHDCWRRRSCNKVEGGRVKFVKVGHG